MLGDISRSEDIYVVCGYTEMHKSIDGPTTIIEGIFSMDPLPPNPFYYVGKNVIVSSLFTGKVMILSYYISAWKMEVLNGLVNQSRQYDFQSRNSDNS